MRKNRLKHKHRGNFDAAYRLIKIAEKGNLLGDEQIKGLIMCVYLIDNSKLYNTAEEYITYRALDNIFWKRERGNYSGNGDSYRKAYQM